MTLLRGGRGADSHLETYVSRGLALCVGYLDAGIRN